MVPICSKTLYNGYENSENSHTVCVIRRHMNYYYYKYILKVVFIFNNTLLKKYEIFFTDYAKDSENS